MSTTAAPHIPPRPSRSQHAAGAGTSRIPEIPARPAHKRLDRSVSPGNHHHSPLYDPPSDHSISRSKSNEPSVDTPPGRPSSVSLPSIGQEGSEYADISYDTTAAANSIGAEGAAQMRSVGGDLTLHAPKPSLSQASAKAQVKTVTRTDDQQAAAHGFGKAGTPTNEEVYPLTRSPTPKATSIPHSSSLPSGPPSRRHSIIPGEDEQGPAEIGLRVPINPNMGDVQAPSPSPLSTLPEPHGPGRKRYHSRTKSGREVFLPPGSYGLHGHGVQTHDKFDKDWYAKHPDQLVHEETIGHGHYSATGSGRGEWALSSDDLNKIVRDTASRGAGIGTKEGVMSYPDERIGYLASDQYSSRIASPAHGGGNPQRLRSNSSQPAVSPMRKASFPADALQRSEFEKSKGSVSGRSEVMDSEPEEDIIHVEDPSRQYNKLTGGEGTVNEAQDFGSIGGSAPDGYVDENGYGVPILASDEVAKDIRLENLQPAVSPKQERRSSVYYGGDEYGGGDITPTSRPSSRPGSIHGFNHSLSRFLSRHEEREDMHTPLEDVDEYEPLFPDEDENKKQPSDATERFKPRPQTLRHRFPSQDIWEDTPSSAMHVTTVSSQDLLAQNDTVDAKSASKVFEDPGVESARKGAVGETDKTNLIPREDRLPKSRLAPHLGDDLLKRPDMQQRFPSRDIWEDTPESMRLVTTVASAPIAGEGPTSPAEVTTEKPSVPPRPPNKSKLGDSQAFASNPLSAEVKQPPVPARPPKRIHAVPSADAKSADVTVPHSQDLEKNISPTEGKKGPALPDRPKPQVPIRPPKKELLEPLTKTISGGSSASQDTITSPPLPRAKPGTSGKFLGNKANLPSAFISDLNQRLQLGPRPPISEKGLEDVVDKEVVAPLSDARKGRARGPQRRAPAKSPGDITETAHVAPPTFAVVAPRSLWSLDEVDGLTVNTDGKGLPPSWNPTPRSGLKDAGFTANPAPSTDLLGAAGPLAPTGFVPGTADDKADLNPMDSASATPATEKSDPLNKSMASLVRENREGFLDLSKQTTASSGGTDGGPLDRFKTRDDEPGNVSNDNSGITDPSVTENTSLSKATTVSSTTSGQPLERVLSRESPTAAEAKVDEIVSATGAELNRAQRRRCSRTTSMAELTSQDNEASVNRSM